MRLALLTLSIGCCAAMLLADGQLLRYHGIQHVQYDATAGMTHPRTGLARRGLNTVWDATTTVGYAITGGRDTLLLDWGDIDHTRPITQLQIAYATRKRQVDPNGPGPVVAELNFFTHDNGRDSTGRVLIGSYRFRGLPGTPDGSEPNTVTAFVVTVPVGSFGPLSFIGPDLDNPPQPGTGDPNATCGDRFGFTDFGYTYYFPESNRRQTGWVLAAPWGLSDPNTCLAVGATDAFDFFRPDPNKPISDPNAIVLPSDFRFQFSAHFGGISFSQLYLKLSEALPCSGDVDGDNDVDLQDLATLLANFGTPSGASLADGDLDGDGDVDLQDLATLLAAFGTVCT